MRRYLITVGVQVAGGVLVSVGHHTLTRCFTCLAGPGPGGTNHSARLLLELRPTTTAASNDSSSGIQLASSHVISSAPLPSLISLLQGPTPLPPELQQVRLYTHMP